MNKWKTLAVGVGLALTVSCGPKGKREELTSRNDDGGATTITRKLAECSRIEASSIPLSGQLGTYYDPMTRMPVVEFVQMNVTKIPEAIQTGTTFYLQFYRWKDGSSGYQINSIPVRLFFVSKITGQPLTTNTVDRISKAVLENLIGQYNLDDLGVTLANFFERHYVVLTGLEYQWMAITAAYYNSALGATATASGNALLPPFYADPNYYAERNPQASLYTLHPNYAYRTSGASDKEFKNLSDEICREFFSTIRLPASADDGFFGYVRHLWGLVTGFLSDIFGL